MFRTVFPSIIRSSKLRIQQQACQTADATFTSTPLIRPRLIVIRYKKNVDLRHPGLSPHRTGFDTRPVNVEFVVNKAAPQHVTS